MKNTFYLIATLEDLNKVARLKNLNVKKIEEGYKRGVGKGISEYLFIKREIIENSCVFAVSSKKKSLYWVRKDTSKQRLIDTIRSHNDEIIPIPDLLFENLDLILNKLEEIT